MTDELTFECPITSVSPTSKKATINLEMLQNDIYEKLLSSGKVNILIDMDMK